MREPWYLGRTATQGVVLEDLTVNAQKTFLTPTTRPFRLQSSEAMPSMTIGPGGSASRGPLILIGRHVGTRRRHSS
ncbi:hypothetical protein ACVILH_004339 [Bradyrhizobium sp. USDA 4353]